MVVNPIYDEGNGAIYDTILELHNVDKTTELASNSTMDPNLDRSEFIINVYPSITYSYIIIIKLISVDISYKFIFQYRYCSSLGHQECSSPLALTAGLNTVDKDITFSTKLQNSDCDIMEEENNGTYEILTRNKEGEESYIQMKPRKI